MSSTIVVPQGFAHLTLLNNIMIFTRLVCFLVFLTLVLQFCPQHSYWSGIVYMSAEHAEELGLNTLKVKTSSDYLLPVAVLHVSYSLC